MNELRVYFDGGGNGEYGYYVFTVLDSEELPVKKWVSKWTGPSTNNQMEYVALIAALKAIRDRGKDPDLEKVTFIGDSQLVINQVIGQYAVRDEALKQLYILVGHIEEDIHVKHGPIVFYQWVPREQNKMGQILEKDKKQGHPNHQSPGKELVQCPHCQKWYPKNWG